MSCDLGKPRETCPNWLEGLCGCAPTPSISHAQVREYLDFLDEQIADWEAITPGSGVAATYRSARGMFLYIMAIKETQ